MAEKHGPRVKLQATLTIVEVHSYPSAQAESWLTGSGWEALPLKLSGFARRTLASTKHSVLGPPHPSPWNSV
jgi:hypothetical protein